MNKFQRIIAPTARYQIQPNSGANLGNRLYTVDCLMDSFNKQVRPEFEKNGYITEKRLAEIYSKLLEGVALKLSKIPRSQKGKSDGRIWPITEFEDPIMSILGYNNQLPFSTKKGERVIKAKKAEQLFHETSHLVQAVLLPKITIKRLLSEHLSLSRKGIWQFQDDFLYTAKALREKTKNGEDYKPIVREGLKELFESADSGQKIELLQNFRHEMMTEKIAHLHGMLYKGDFDIHPEIIALKANKTLSPEKKEEVLAQAFENWKILVTPEAEEIYENIHHFDGKSKIIKRMLKAELKKVRTGFKATNKVTNPFSKVAQ